MGSGIIDVATIHTMINKLFIPSAFFLKFFYFLFFIFVFVMFYFGLFFKPSTHKSELFFSIFDL